MAHRKRIKHYEHPAHVRELTFSCYRRLPLLTNDTWRHWLAEHIDRATARHGFCLTAFVFMPEHVHLLLYRLPQAASVSLLLTAIKRPFSVRIKRLLHTSGSALLAKLTVRQRPGVSTFRFWQEGPGYDRNLIDTESVAAAIDYIHLNPVRRGLVNKSTQWRWSSAGWYTDPNAPVDPLLPQLHKLPAAWLSSG